MGDGARRFDAVQAADLAAGIAGWARTGTARIPYRIKDQEQVRILHLDPGSTVVLDDLRDLAPAVPIRRILLLGDPLRICRQEAGRNREQWSHGKLWWRWLHKAWTCLRMLPSLRRGDQLWWIGADHRPRRWRV